jgi:alkanesulfonate monooxygenase SsuD/methylene tetrahydromethanopterin reductase-like flavin-dependent oxidoreductase (luciferase family)
MEFGVLIGDVPRSVSPADHLSGLLRQVDAAQRNGFTLVTLGQHVLYGDVRWLQPIPTLARLAGELEPSVRLATTVVIAPLYHPVVLAEELATLDIITGGRLDVGLGVGYRREEYRQLGIPFAERVPRFEECVQLLRELWTRDRVTFEGRFWSLDDAEPHLFPVQRPTPPIWIGASSAAGVRRSARLGDAWPIGPRMATTAIAEHLAIYDAERERLGRPATRHPIRREIVVGATRAEALDRFVSMTSQRYAEYAERERMSIPGGRPAGHDEPAIVGTPDQVVAELRALATSLPIGPVIVRVQWPGMTDDDVVRYLDELGALVVAPLRDAPSLRP